MQGLHLPSALGVGYAANSGTSRGLSSAIWQGLQANAASKDGSSLVFVGDDFLVCGQSVATASNVGCYTSLAGQYKSYEGSSATVAQSATAGTGGVLTLGLPATDNIVSAICQGGAGTSAATSVLGAINRDTLPAPVAFEARFKVSSIANDVIAVFVGLMEEDGAVVGSKVDATGVTIDNDFIGFNTIHYNAGTAVTSTPTITPVTGQNAKLQFVYKKDGQTLQVPIATLATLVADTYVKVGFYYNPFAAEAKRLKIYYNGVAHATTLTDTDLNAATFPDGEELGFTAIAKSGADGSTGASSLSLDWWAWGTVV